VDLIIIHEEVCVPTRCPFDLTFLRKDRPAQVSNCTI